MHGSGPSGPDDADAEVVEDLDALDAEVAAEMLINPDGLGDGVPVPLCDAVVDAALAASGPDADVDDASDADAERGALAAAEAPPVPTVADLVTSAEVDRAGYVTSPIHPWGRRAIGRITTWPAHKPLENRSVSAKCYLHPGCASPAKSRRTCSDAVLLEWLMSGQVPPPGATHEVKQAMIAAHRAQFAAIFARGA